jgi:hypothetical protein
MPAKVEAEVATVSREVGNGTQRLVRESEACLGRGWSTALEMSSKRSDGSLKVGFVGTAIELVSRISSTRQHSFHSLVRESVNSAVCVSRASSPSSNTSSLTLYDQFWF